MFWTMKAIKRLPLNVKTLLNIFGVNRLKSIMEDPLGLIARLRHIFPSCTLLNIYQSLIAHYLTYALISWHNACKTFLDQILVFEKRALRLIC